MTLPNVQHLLIPMGEKKYLLIPMGEKNIYGCIRVAWPINLENFPIKKFQMNKL